MCGSTVDIRMSSQYGELRLRSVGEFGAPKLISMAFASLAALLHSTLVGASAKLCGVKQSAPPIFGRAAITLGIGPHSSYIFFAIGDVSVMAALRSRYGHYIFVLFLSSFFPRLISAVADWMYTILPHMTYP